MEQIEPVDVTADITIDGTSDNTIAVDSPPDLVEQKNVDSSADPTLLAIKKLRKEELEKARDLLKRDIAHLKQLYLDAETVELVKEMGDLSVTEYDEEGFETIVTPLDVINVRSSGTTKEFLARIEELQSILEKYDVRINELNDAIDSELAAALFDEDLTSAIAQQTTATTPRHAKFKKTKKPKFAGKQVARQIKGNAADKLGPPYPSLGIGREEGGATTTGDEKPTNVPSYDLQLDAVYISRSGDVPYLQLGAVYISSPAFPDPKDEISGHYLFASLDSAMNYINQRFNKAYKECPGQHGKVLVGACEIADGGVWLVYGSIKSRHADT